MANIASNPNEQVFYVYVLLDPRKPGVFKYGRWSLTHEPFYVGKGKGGRDQAHYLRSNQWVKNTILKLARLGTPHLVKRLRQKLTEDQAYEFEAKVIDTIGRKDKKQGPLRNLLDGGYGASSSMVVTAKQKRNKSRVIKEMWDVMPEEAKQSRVQNMKNTLKSKLEQDPNYLRMRALKVAESRRRGKHYQHWCESRSSSALAFFARETPEQKTARYAKASKSRAEFYSQVKGLVAEGYLREVAVELVKARRRG